MRRAGTSGSGPRSRRCWSSSMRSPAGHVCCSSESPAAGGAQFERRQQAVQALARALVTETQAEENNSGWFVPWPELTAELVVGGSSRCFVQRMLEERDEPFVELAPSLTAFIMAQYPGLQREPRPQNGRQTRMTESRSCSVCRYASRIARRACSTRSATLQA